MKFIWSRCMQVLALAAAVLAAPVRAMAQALQQPEPHGSVVQAVIVFLCVTLGLVLVNRSANRKSELLIDEIEEE